MNIAILGATSQIAKGLIENFSKLNYNLFLFARSTEKVLEFTELNQILGNLNIYNYDSFCNNFYDLIINCVGIADPKKQKEKPQEIFIVTESYDNLVLKYLLDNKKTIYINFSSGAVYGTSFSDPVKENSKSIIEVNSIQPTDYYRIAKINSEVKHRAYKENNIIDLRVFSYFSKYIDLNSGFLMTDIVNAIINKKTLLTSEVNIIRDYISPKDLFNLIKLIINNPFNGVLDCYSAAPVSKFELLESMKNIFGLCYEINCDTNIIQSTGSKNIYCSINKNAGNIGYIPNFTSLDVIINESQILCS